MRIKPPLPPHRRSRSIFFLEVVLWKINIEKSGMTRVIHIQL
jgi:hypothetical protein